MVALKRVPLSFVRNTSTTTATSTKAAGDISSVFPSLSGKAPDPLPPRFQTLKTQLSTGREQVLTDSWSRLLDSLREEVKKIKALGSDAIPSISYRDIQNGTLTQEQLNNIRHRGSVVIRGVIPKETALKYKEKVREYIKSNKERVKAFPNDDPAVYELYWAPSQVHARTHPGMINTQKFLAKLWYSSNPLSQISTTHPLMYADRFRIRNPGDAKFALGPHSDGGSLERWEDPEYRRCYSKILEGKWEEYDPFDANHRISAHQDLYNGAGACSMFRFFQGWLSMSSTGPGEGTLKIYPLLRHATAYLVLRPFMTTGSIKYLNAEFPGAVPGACQEYNNKTHPDLDLADTMCSVPHVEPGDYVAWHCDSIHSVDKEHHGQGDSSVLYIPVCPLTSSNAQYLVRQREAALKFSPPPDFPDAGGVGERGFVGQLDWDTVSDEGLHAMGMGSNTWTTEENMSDGEKAVIETANRRCFG
ncbi:DUF1479 domain protein [Talaromyces stipitatus ATCC 10500]|uniref:DUF1479 domain protein n=1 Tax=Talaromyces stipitatus (strain ATCC 10500 / CBS 375.48 / QM 6759 / NRRL 1006) TaxID=441959 RepID=B8MAW5_TALSN|nr:DUF1479 domain protein [Talaromyces stipitatus ATCC 10500]EED18666.1 DUF1479 domain protein [Talaromyces stipitatus ATCC 10500]